MKISRKALKIFILTAIFAIFPFATANASFIKTETNYHLPQEERIEENTYISALNANIDGDILGDLSVAAQDVVIDSAVEGDVTIVGQVVNLRGQIKGDVKVTASEVVIDGNIDGDLFVFAGETRITKSAVIGGKSMLFGGTLVNDGLTKNYSTAIVSQVILNGTIEDLMQITTQNIKVDRDLQIPGHLEYFSPEQAHNEYNVDLTNSSFNQIDSIRDSGIVKRTILSFISFWVIIRFITDILIALIIVSLFKTFAQFVSKKGIGHFATNFITGVLSAFSILILSMVLFLSLIGLPLGSILFTLGIFFAMITPACAGIMLGYLIKVSFKKESSKFVGFPEASLGVILLTLVQFVPYVGALIRWAFFLATFGVIIKYIYARIRHREEFIYR